MNDLNFKRELAAHFGGEDVMSCFLCGTCTAACPVSEMDVTFSPRTIMQMVLYGERDEVLSSDMLWKCCQCRTCTARCPQSARPSDVIAALREMADRPELAAKLAEIEYSIKDERLARINAMLGSESGK